MNSFTSNATICKAPESIKLGEREGMRIRMVDKVFGKKAVDRFFTIIVTGPDVDVAKRVKVGDQLMITGCLVQEEYTNKAGQTVKDDTIPFGKILNVTKSPSFFGAAKPEAAEDDSGPIEAPTLASKAPNPLDSL